MPARHLRRLTDRLGFRITFLLALALLPLAVLSAVQTVSLAREAQSRSEAAILGNTVRVAAPVLQHILRAQGAAKTLASAIAEVAGDAAQCREVMARFARNNPFYSLVAFVPDSGKVTCSGDGKSYDFSHDDGFLSAIKTPRTSFEVSTMGAVSGVAVLSVIYPVIDGLGHRVGIVSLSIPQHALEAALAGAAAASGNPHLRLFTFDGKGNVLTSTNGIDQDRPYLPLSGALSALAGVKSTAFTSWAQDGHRRIFAVVPIVVGKLYALSSWPETAARVGMINRLPPVVLPALMAIVSLFAAWMAAESLVLRHVRRLRHNIRAFASGSRLVPPSGRDRAPLEIRDLEDNFTRMTETILRDEAELENAVHQKEVLLREVHHRIKNNLQLIASIMNMQMRRETSGHVKAMMKNLQDRVMSLATIHRGLYQTTGVTDVHADELLRDIVGQVVSFSTGPGRRFKVKTDFADLMLTPDQAVPLSLLLTEALTNAMKYGGSADGVPELSVSLLRDGEESAVLRLSNSLAPDAPPPDEAESSGFGSQLINAFARQLGGELTTRREDGRYRLELRFTVTPLSDAEARRDAGEPAPDDLGAEDGEADEGAG